MGDEYQPIDWQSDELPPYEAELYPDDFLSLRWRPPGGLTVGKMRRAVETTERIATERGHEVVEVWVNSAGVLCIEVRPVKPCVRIAGGL